MERWVDPTLSSLWLESKDTKEQLKFIEERRLKYLRNGFFIVTIISLMKQKPYYQHICERKENSLTWNIHGVSIVLPLLEIS